MPTTELTCDISGFQPDFGERHHHINSNSGVIPGLRKRLLVLPLKAVLITADYSSLVLKTWDTRFWSKEAFDEMQKIDRKSGLFGFLKSVGKDIVAPVGSMVWAIDRRMNLRGLNELKQKAEQLFDENRFLFYQVNALIRQSGLEAVYFNNPLGSRRFELDNSLSNENWGEEFDHFGEELQKAVEEFSGVAKHLDEQLALLEKGEFPEAALVKSPGYDEAVNQIMTLLDRQWTPDEKKALIQRFLSCICSEKTTPDISIN